MIFNPTMSGGGGGGEAPETVSVTFKNSSDYPCTVYYNDINYQNHADEIGANSSNVISMVDGTIFAIAFDYGPDECSVENAVLIKNADGLMKLYGVGSLI